MKFMEELDLPSGVTMVSQADNFVLNVYMQNPVAGRVAVFVGMLLIALGGVQRELEAAGGGAIVAMFGIFLALPRTSKMTFNATLRMVEYQLSLAGWCWQRRTFSYEQVKGWRLRNVFPDSAAPSFQPILRLKSGSDFPEHPSLANFTWVYDNNYVRCSHLLMVLCRVTGLARLDDGPLAHRGILS